MPSKKSNGFLGVLMLETRFPRPLGDVGHPQTFERAGIPVRYLVVEGASVERVVHQADPSLLEPFIQAAQDLIAQGASMISTSCGFLAAHQKALSSALPVPIVTSSLLQCQHLPNCGIVTFDAAALSKKVLDGAQVLQGTPIEGLAKESELYRVITHDETTLDAARAEACVVEAAEALVKRHPALEHIVLECTNMPPYRQAVAFATGRPVHDIETYLLARWRQLHPEA